MPFSLRRLDMRGPQFLVLIVTAMVAAYARFLISPLQESIRASLALSDNQMALLQGPALALPMIVGAIPLGLLIDRRSRVQLLVLLAALNLAGSALTAVAASFTMLFAARCLVGLAVSSMSTAVFSLLADFYAPTERGRASMLIILGQYAGMSVAFALGGMLLTHHGDGPADWRGALLWLSCPLVVAIGLLLIMREPPRTGSPAKDSIWESLTALWRHRGAIAPPLIGLVTAEVAVLAVLTWASPVFSRDFSLPPDRVGTIMAGVVLISGVVGPFLGGIIADRCQRLGGPRRTMSVLSAMAFLCIPASSFAILRDANTAAITLVLFMTIVGSMLVIGIALFTIVVPNELRGLCVATLAAAQVLFGVALAPVAVSALSAMIGGPTMIGMALAAVCAAASVLGTAAFWLGMRYFPRVG